MPCGIEKLSASLFEKGFKDNQWQEAVLTRKLLHEYYDSSQSCCNGSRK